MIDALFVRDSLNVTEAEEEAVKLVDWLADSDADVLWLELAVSDDVALCEVDADKLALPLAVADALIVELVLAVRLRE